MRKEILINIADDGKELTFKIKQMSALKQERWINKVIILLAGSQAASKLLNGLEIKNIEKSLEKKFANLDSLVSTLGQLDYDKVEPLYNELLECCSHVPNPNNPAFSTQLTVQTADSIIGEVKTLYKLRMEALKVNFNFFGRGVQSPARKTADITITKHM